MTVKYKCIHCGNAVGKWHYGWKHHGGWHTPPSCGRKLTSADVVATNLGWDKS